jgi:hypothetical protein
MRKHHPVFPPRGIVSPLSGSYLVTELEVHTDPSVNAMARGDHVREFHEVSLGIRH